MLEVIIVALYALLMASLGIVIIGIRYSENEKKDFNINSVFKHHKIYIALSVCMYFLLIVMVIIGKCVSNEISIEAILRWFTLLWGCLVIGYIDYKEHLIPNKIVLGMIGIRLVYMVIEVIQNKEYLKIVIMYPFLGAFIGALVMIIGMVISRKGLGMGDIKLFFVVGLYVGSQGIIPTMMYTFVISAAVGLILLALRRLKLKDVLPLAPFVFVGVLFKFILIMYGGIN